MPAWEIGGILEIEMSKGGDGRGATDREILQLAAGASRSIKTPSKPQTLAAATP